MKIGYVRVPAQDELQLADLQRNALLAAGVQEHNIFEDKVPAIYSKRPELGKALDSLREGDELIIWSLDRMARDFSDLIAIVNRLKEKRVGLVSLTEQIDTSTVQGLFVLQLFGSFAQFELALLTERIIEGQAAAKARGSKMGRPRAISKEKMVMILESVKQGKSKASIARALDIKRTSLFSALRQYRTQEIATHDKMNSEQILYFLTEGVHVHE